MSATETHASYDLHLHSCWSYDATAEVESYFKRARALGMRCLAITDHHVLDSLSEIAEVARNYPEIAVVPSAELTVTTSIGPVDLLCYGFPLDFPESLQQLLEQYHDWQRRTGAAISRAAVSLGYDFTDAHRLELLRAYRPERAMEVQGNTHVKNAFLRAYFVERGFIEKEEEFPSFMRKLRERVEFPPYPSVEEVVPVVKAVGALVAIAHPHGYFAQGDPERMERLRRECRLDGIECAHQNVPADFTPMYREYCVRHGLFSTGGSDCHEEAEISSSLAGHGGPDAWLDEFLDRTSHRIIR